MKAWHFTGATLRDGRPIPAPGETLRHGGPVKICRLGLHASERILDALRYAPGPIVHRVECAEIVRHHGDKFVCRERTILWSLDATDILRAFARRCALDVIHLWDAPDVVRRYLETGDESLRAAAWDATRAADWNATRAANRAAAKDDAKDDAKTAARTAVRAADRDADRDAARAAAWDKYNGWLTEMVEAGR